MMVHVLLSSIWCTDDSYEYDASANTDDGSCYFSSIWMYNDSYLEMMLQQTQMMVHVLP